MPYYSKIDIVDKRAPDVIAEVKEYGPKDLFGCAKVIKVSKQKVPQYFCKIGDEVKIITDDPRPWRVVVIAERNGKRFPIKVNEIICK